ncbi:hypothetical protein WA1_39810 [Scytonema hofmannii PCC 7110]|uniref:Uncharacterized protein n=1 Tax=Scytonema hofmannii PCC 7110 TaxID=128403 RepID=A0A139WYY5_9CYAN|nr:hypothetical protein [Scytonema hofmannii]KYC37613.1 hypothetical protein WA1_39810 [Scytonema hofmannii PCC 7110]
MHFSLTSSFKKAIVKKYYESVNSLLDAKKMDINLKLITSIGFEVVTDIDISHNVLLSCDEKTEQYLKIFQDNNLFQDESERLSITNFICSPGSERYQAFASGYYQQRIFKFRKVSKKTLV